MNRWDDGAENWVTNYRRCGSKTTYVSRREARQARRRLKTDKGIVVTVYRCPDCRGYHLGHDRRHFTPRINPAYREMQTIYTEGDSDVDND
jgi:hypothetical protein